MVALRPREGSALCCAVCHDDVRGARQCARCGTWTHTECRRGRCPTLGCDPASGSSAERAPGAPWLGGLVLGRYQALALLFVGYVQAIVFAGLTGWGLAWWLDPLAR